MHVHDPKRSFGLFVFSGRRLVRFQLAMFQQSLRHADKVVQPVDLGRQRVDLGRERVAALVRNLNDISHRNTPFSLTQRNFYATQL